jgi:hypothetical protein
MRNLLIGESMGVGLRKEVTVCHSMYACVRDAVLLIRGAMRSAVIMGGVRVRVRPSIVVDAMFAAVVVTDWYSDLERDTYIVKALWSFGRVRWG